MVKEVFRTFYLKKKQQTYIKSQYEMKYPHTNEFYNNLISSMNRQNCPFCLLQMCYNECPNFFN